MTIEDFPYHGDHAASLKLNEIIDLIQSGKLKGLDLTNFLDVAINNSSGSVGMQTIPNQAFTTIICGTVRSDAGNNYNATTGLYTVPKDEMYSIVARVRIRDSTGDNANFGIGVHSDNNDGDWFQWSIIPVGMRKTLLYARKARFTAGQQLRLYAYADSASGVQIANANLTIEPHGV